MYREEPITDNEVKKINDEGLNIKDANGWIWAAFFVVRHQEARALLGRVLTECEQIVTDPLSATHVGSKYSSIIVAIYEGDFLANASEQESKLWMSCMRAARDYEAFGATLFSPQKFIKYDPVAFRSLVSAATNVDSEEYFARYMKQCSIVMTPITQGETNTR